MFMEIVVDGKNGFGPDYHNIDMIYLLSYYWHCYWHCMYVEKNQVAQEINKYDHYVEKGVGLNKQRLLPTPLQTCLK